MRTGYMRDMHSPRSGGALLLALFLTACVPQGATEPDLARFQPTKEEQAELTAFGHAGAISKVCSGEFRRNYQEAERVLRPVVDRAQAAGVRAQYEPAVLLGLTSTKMRQIGLAYEAERGIVREDRETWCAAGRYEVTNKTMVGKYLTWVKN
jgi:hypothetical protein